MTPEGGRGLALAVAVAAAFLLTVAPPAVGQDAPKARLLPQAEVKAELGIDSLDRRFYRPIFTFSWPVALLGSSRIRLEIDYLQRMNGDLQGVIDYWVRVGAENRVWGDDAGGSVSVEAVLNHFCRHLASIANPYVLNLNELMGRVVVRSGGAALGAGFGPFIGGSRGYGHLASFTLDAAPFLLPEAIVRGRAEVGRLRAVLLRGDLVGGPGRRGRDLPAGGQALRLSGRRLPRAPAAVERAAEQARRRLQRHRRRLSLL